MAFCENCGTQLNDGAQFCPKCGQSTNGTGNVQEPGTENSFENEHEEEQIKTWQKFVCVLLWPVGAILTIVAFVKKQHALAKSSLLYTGAGLVLAFVINASSLGGCSDLTGDIEEEGYEHGYDFGFNMANTNMEPDAKQTFSAHHGAPETQEEKQLFNEYKKGYERGFRDGKKAGRE